MSAADRPSVTDNARAEAMRRYTSDIADRGLTYPTGAVREHSRAAFVAGAEWAAGRAETTTATDEDAVSELLKRMSNAATRLEALRAEHWDAPERQRLHGKVEGVKLAASYVEEARGLLATARTRPTRDELAKVICESRCSPQRKSWLETADAVLALLRDGA